MEVKYASSICDVNVSLVEVSDSHSGLATTTLVMEVAPENRMGCILLTIYVARLGSEVLY